MYQRGQVVIILLLTMLVGLTVGLVVTQRSISDVTQSTQTEQATRAFSAAEAGLEKALSTSGSVALGEADLGNQSSADVNLAPNLPSGTNALEYPPINKTTIAQFWLASPSSPIGAPSGGYTLNNFTIYFGNPSSIDRPAVEVNVVTWTGGSYASNRYFYDSVSRSNNFTYNPAACNGSRSATVSGIDGPSYNSVFLCAYNVSYTGTPVLSRVRLLYSDEKHKVALMPNGGSLPPQAAVYTSTGASGQSQKTIKAFQVKNVVPFFFDFAIFSAGDISK